MRLCPGTGEFWAGRGTQIGARVGGRSPSDQSFGCTTVRLERPKQRATTDQSREAIVIFGSLFSSGCRDLARRASFAPRLALYWPTAAEHARRGRQIWRTVHGLVTYFAVAERNDCRAQGNTTSRCRSMAEEVLKDVRLRPGRPFCRRMHGCGAISVASTWAIFPVFASQSERHLIFHGEIPSFPSPVAHSASSVLPR